MFVEIDVKMQVNVMSPKESAFTGASILPVKLSSAQATMHTTTTFTTTSMDAVVFPTVPSTERSSKMVGLQSTIEGMGKDDLNITFVCQAVRRYVTSTATIYSIFVKF